MRVEITGSELGPYNSIDELRKKARAYAEKNIRGAYTVKSNGDIIVVGKNGIKHSTTTPNANKIKAVVAIPRLIENSELVKVEPDKKGRSGIKAVRKYAATLIVKKKEHPVLIVVRETEEGRLFYDHYIDKKPVGSQGSDEQLTYGPSTGSNDTIPKKGGGGNIFFTILFVIGAALLGIHLNEEAA
jgi:hypothetical protein